MCSSSDSDSESEPEMRPPEPKARKKKRKSRKQRDRELHESRKVTDRRADDKDSRGKTYSVSSRRRVTWFSPLNILVLGVFVTALYRWNMKTLFDVSLSCNSLPWTFLFSESLFFVFIVAIWWLFDVSFSCVTPVFKFLYRFLFSLFVHFFSKFLKRRSTGHFLLLSLIISPFFNIKFGKLFSPFVVLWIAVSDLFNVKLS